MSSSEDQIVYLEYGQTITLIYIYDWILGIWIFFGII